MKGEFGWGRKKKFLGKKKLIPFLGKFSPEMNAYQYFWSKPFINTWQIVEFNPKNYEGDNYEEKKKFSYEDAKQHENFYKNLINQGIYPEGTKVKTKRKRHSNSYFLDFWMPEIKKFNPQYMGGYNKVESNFIKEKIDSLIRKMSNTLKDYGINNLHEDPYHLWNYGVDNQGKIRYMDTEIFEGKLPFERRIKNKGTLEKSVLGLGAVVGFVFSLFFLSSNVTGSVIGNAGASSNNVAGIITLTASFLLAFLALRK